MSVFGGLLGIGGSLLGGLLDGDGGVGDANAANAAPNAQIRNLFKGQQVKNRLGFIEAEKRFREQIDNAEGRLDRSEADVRGITRGAKQSVHDNAQRQTAGASQSLLNRGLLNSSVGANMQRGIASDTQRNLSNIDAQQSGVLSQLGQRRAGLMASLEGGLARLPVQENQLGTNLTGMFSNALGQQEHVPTGQTGGMSSLFGQFAPSLAGLFGGDGNGFF